MAAFDAALAGGAATLDLTSLGDESADMSGLKMRALFARGKSTNAAVITMAPAVADGYEFQGADGQVQAHADDLVQLYLGDNAPAVAAGAKDIALAGTGSEVLQLVMLFG